MMHDSFHIDIRQRLWFLRDNMTDCAIGREAFLAQVMTWLLVGGVGTVTIERTFYPDHISKLGELLSLPLDAQWARETIDRALALLPKYRVMKISHDSSKEPS